MSIDFTKYPVVQDVKYIEDNQSFGIQYDWKLIRKAYKELKCPSVYYNPCKCPLESCKYFVEFSQRSIGKTTNWLLLGIIMHLLYGTQIQYIRQTTEEITPKISWSLFLAITENDYVFKLTKGRWTNIIYDKRKWYLGRVGSDGVTIEERAKEPFCYMLNVRDHLKYKSGYNAPKGDLIIYDEFISDIYYPDEFVMFCDLTKTIIRDRRSPIVVMLANNTDKESPYFSEMEIYDTVRQMIPAQSVEVTTVKGTRIYIEYISADAKKQKMLDVLNGLFYGFRNKRLGSITGEDWAIRPRQRIPEGEITDINRQLYIYHNERYIRFDIVNHETLGICCYLHWASQTYRDSYIMTLQDRTDPRYHYGLGSYEIETLIRQLRGQNRIYYASNDVAAFFDNYCRECN